MKKSILILSVAVSFLLMGCSNNQNNTTHSETQITEATSGNFKSPKTNITVEEALALSKEGALIIDVREPDELAELSYDVKEIKNIPLGELETRISEVPKDKQVIVVCRSGGRSSNAYELLKSKGFENISNMEGGKMPNAWHDKGFPVKTNQ